MEIAGIVLVTRNQLDLSLRMLNWLYMKVKNYPDIETIKRQVLEDVNLAESTLKSITTQINSLKNYLTNSDPKKEKNEQFANRYGQTDITFTQHFDPFQYPMSDVSYPTQTGETMNVQDYQKLAMRTRCPQEQVADKLLMLPQVVQLLHAHIGLVGEAAELTDKGQVNHVEELGDSFWYLAEGYSSLNEQLPPPSPEDLATEQMTPEVFLVDHIYNITRGAELFEKLLWYNQEVSRDKFLDYFQNVASSLYVLCDKVGLDPYKVMQANIAKLQKRYPEKFDENLCKEENRNRQVEADTMADFIKDPTGEE